MHEILAVPQHRDDRDAQRVEKPHELAKALGVLAGAIGDNGEFSLVAVNLGDQQKVGDTTRCCMNVHGRRQYGYENTRRVARQLAQVVVINARGRIHDPSPPRGGLVSYILDTNVISELVAERPHADVVQWVGEADPDRHYLSVITIGEIKKGIEKLGDHPRRLVLDEWLSNDLMQRFRGRLILIDTKVMLAWGVLVADLERSGKPMPAIDSLLAAQAAQTGFTLVTRNSADFEHVPITVFNPWKAPR